MFKKTYVVHFSYTDNGVVKQRYAIVRARTYKQAEKYITDTEHRRGYAISIVFTDTVKSNVIYYADCYAFVFNPKKG